MALSLARARAFRPLQMESLENRIPLAVVRDTSFGTNGIAAVTFGVLPKAGNATLQKDGKIIVVGGEGSQKRGDERSMIVARFNKNGTLDKTFSEDGRVKIPFGQDASAVAVQDDGKIIVSRFSTVYRFKADGSSDATFGGGSGYIFTKPQINIQDLDVLPNGKIILVGYTSQSDLGSKVAVARLNSDGSPDTSFGKNGATIGFKGAAFGMRLYDNGKILVSGGSNFGDFRAKFPDRRMLLVRFNANGTVDKTFGNNGQAQALVGRGGNIAYDPMILPSGKIIAAGVTFNAQNNHDFALARFTANGKLDTTFGQKGKVITSLGQDDVAINARSQPGGKILLTGSRTSGEIFRETSDVAMVRYLPGGKLDPSFGKAGKLIVDLGGDEATPAIAQASGGLITIAGNKDGKLMVMRFKETLPRTQALALATNTPAKKSTFVPAALLSAISPATIPTGVEYAAAVDAVFVAGTGRELFAEL